MFRKDAYENPANEDVMDNMATLFVPPEEFTLAVDLSGLSFYQASVYYFMIEDEDLNL